LEGGSRVLEDQVVDAQGFSLVAHQEVGLLMADIAARAIFSTHKLLLFPVFFHERGDLALDEPAEQPQEAGGADQDKNLVPTKN